MKKVLFVCHGNICRSPMAEFVMKDLVEKAGLSAQFEIASAATSTEEIGNPVYPPARRKLAEHGISCAGKTARQMTRRDYETHDYLIAMDHNNLRNMERFVGSDPEHKVSLLMDHTRRPGDVADPWRRKCMPSLGRRSRVNRPQQRKKAAALCCPPSTQGCTPLPGASTGRKPPGICSLRQLRQRV